MGMTERFKEEHQFFIEQVVKINNYLNNEDIVKANATQIRSILSTLVGAVKLHLNTEDQTLYPMLAKSKDAKVAEMAQRFQSEMGGIKKAFEDYAKKWATPALIQADPKNFIAETNAVFKVLGMRIEKENSELYVAADKIS